MAACKGLIQNVSADEFEIELIGGNTIKVPYHSKYSHMEKYDVIWVFIHDGIVTELHTLRCLERKSKLSTMPTNSEVPAELRDIEHCCPIVTDE